MEFEGSRRAAHAPNLTPLIDIVFLLLVFFMLTAHFVTDEAFTIELPDAENAAEFEKDKPVEVVIDSRGVLHISGKEVKDSLLAQSLAELLKPMKKKFVVIRGDKGATLGKAITVFDAAKCAGAESVDIITERP